jgi:prevent-host-death family protein
MEVGIRELRNNLSRYVDRARRGEEIVVTDHGRAIARILPIGGERTLDRLIASGLVTPAQKAKKKSGRPVKSAGPVSDLVADQRR